MAAVVRQPSGQKFRSGRFRGCHGSGEESIQIDFNKAAEENVKEILTSIIRQTAFSQGKQLCYLNVFVRLIDKLGDISKLGFPLRIVLKCLIVPLVHAPKEVRAGALRVIKHLINDEASLKVLVDIHLDYLIARSVDLCLDNEVERIHGQKLIRKLITQLPHALPRSLVNPLISIGNDGAAERDRMVRASLANVCELTYSNPDLVAHCGGISMLLRKILDCHQFPRINESLVATILHLVNYPSTRHFIRINTDLEQLIAPFTDCQFSHTGELQDPMSTEDRKSRFAASRMAIITVLRSWPGIIRFCQPGGTGLPSLIGILYLPFNEIRHAVLEMLFELFNLTIHEWTSDFNDALLGTDPSKMRDDWHLTEGFVANEGKAILPHTATVRPNLVENHLALLLSTWIGAGILDALVEVIITSENELFIQAVILLGELLHLGNQLLPPECSHHSHYLPSLMALASSFNIPNSRRHQASVAITYLNRIHNLKKRGPIPCSLYLDQLVKQSDKYKDRQLSLNMQRNKLDDMYIRKYAASSEDMCMQTLKDTQVLNTKDNQNWNWDLVEYILKWPDDKMKKLEDQYYVRFIKRLVYFFKPTTHLFSCLDFACECGRKYAVVGCQLLDFLVRCEQDEGSGILTDFLADISLCLSEVASQHIVTDSVFSALNLVNTLSHYYFLFVGRLSRSAKGDRLIEKSGIYQQFLEIVSVALHDNYVKLITSSLYYGRPGNCRTVLNKALCSASESGRLYSTKLMRVLLRAKVQHFSDWGMELLVTQLYDQSHGVAMMALTVLDEACEIKSTIRWSNRQGNPGHTYLDQIYLNTDKTVKVSAEEIINYAEDKQLWNLSIVMYKLTARGYPFLSSWFHISYPGSCYFLFQENLDSLVAMKPSFLHLGEKGTMILCRFMSTSAGFNFLTSANYTMNELNTWHTSFNTRYVQIVEESLNKAFTTYEKTYDGSYTRWSNKVRTKKDVFVPPHLYGQLVQNRDSFLLLRKQTYIEDYFECVRCQELHTVEDVLKLKVALWVVGHISLSSWGMAWLLEEKLVPEVIRMAEESIVYSIRGTAFFILGMVSSTREGAELLSQYGWESRWNTRSENWPQVEDRDTLLEDSMKELHSVASFNVVCSRNDIGSPVSNLDLIAEEQGKFRFDTKAGCENNEDCDSESGIYIPDMQPRAHSPVSHHHNTYLKTQTFPKSHGMVRSHTLPHKKRGFSFAKFVKGRTYSFDFLSGHKDATNSQEQLHTKTRNESPKHLSVINCDVSEQKMLCGDTMENKLNSTCNSLQRLPENGLKDDEVFGEVSTHIIANSKQLTLDNADQCRIKHETNTNNSTNDGNIQINITDIDEVPLMLKIDYKNRCSGQCSISDITETSKTNGAQTEHICTQVENYHEYSETKANLLQKSLETKIMNTCRNDDTDSSKIKKRQANSFKADTSSSSVSSYDSGHHGVLDLPLLSPIMSTNSSDHMEVQMRPKENKGHHVHHHSTILRRLSNLSHIPSIKRPSSPVGALHPASKYYDFSENAIQYATARDAVGYATFRELTKNRTISSDGESDYGNDKLFNVASMSSIAREPSNDNLEVRQPLSMLRNFSGLSLSEMDNPAHVQPPKASLYHQRPHTGQAEFMGITLPVDNNMIFELHEDDDPHTDSFIGSGISRQASFENHLKIQRMGSTHSENKGAAMDQFESQTFNFPEQMESNDKHSKPHASCSIDIVPVPLSSEHNPEICILCCGIVSEMGITSSIHTIEGGPERSEGIKLWQGINQAQASSANDQLTDASGSPASTVSEPSVGKKMTFNTPAGRTLIRKEVLRLVINLSSSVGMKGAEEGLLSLKQKFPKAFQDLCYYSEVSSLLGSCSFSLAARRFIQELFEDIDISKILNEAYSILGIDDNFEKASTNKSLQEDFDEFTESFS